MRNYNKLNKQLYALREDNKNLNHNLNILQDVISSKYDEIVEKNKENENLEKLAKLGTSLNIIMTQMLSLCDEDTLVGSAYKSAILQFQRALAKGFGYLQVNNSDNQTAIWNTPLIL